MNPDAMPKVFDISKPRPSSSGRPVIVGHQPTMPDPMVKRPAAPAPVAPTTAPTTPVREPSNEGKTIPVTDDMRQAIFTAHYPLEAIKPAEPVAPTTDSHQTVPSAPSEAAPTPPVVPAEPAISAPETSPPVTPPAPVPTPEVQPAAEPHFHSLPVAHEPVTAPRMLRRIILWLIVFLLLAAVAAYLLIDAGIIHSNVNLPVHIFND